MTTDLVTFRYLNHRGEEAARAVRPIRLWWGSTAWHPEAGWLLEAFDLDKQATRDFAMSGMRGPWTPAAAEDRVAAQLARQPGSVEALAQRLGSEDIVQ